MTEKKQYKSVYFVGAGGIGMAALVRYYLSKGLKVAGYDRTRTALTDELTAEGAEITYDDAAELIPGYCRDKATTLVVYTPAVPSTHRGLTYFRDGGFEVMKRPRCSDCSPTTPRGSASQEHTARPPHQAWRHTYCTPPR